MCVTLLGIGGIALANSYAALMVASAVIGVGSATFHPEASRVARMASGGRFSLAQSMFQVGGNSGAALGPLFASVIILPTGQAAFGWLAVVAIVAITVLFYIARWRLHNAVAKSIASAPRPSVTYDRATVTRGLTIVSLLMFAKFIYIGAITNYLTFYLIAQFGLTARSSQVYLFCFLAAVAVGVFIGGPISDRIGQKNMIWFSFLGVAPLTLLMPHVGLAWTAVLVSVVGLVLSTSLSALVVYAQEIVPGRVGMVSGIMYGLMFGFSGIAAAGLGYLADIYGIVWVYQLIAYLPLLGFATALLPKLDHG